MEIDLKEIGAAGIRIERTIPAAGFFSSAAGGADRGLRLLADAVLTLAVKRAGKRYHLRGTLEAEVEVECGRCLTSYSIAVRPAFDYYLVPRRHVEEWAEVEIDDTAKREVEVDSMELDLLHLAEEQVRLGVPMKLLCSENCQGLCLMCGADLNRERCRCSGENLNQSGLSELSSLLELMKSDPSDN